jgi:hypothetical protein
MVPWCGVDPGLRICKGRDRIIGANPGRLFGHSVIGEIIPGRWQGIFLTSTGLMVPPVRGRFGRGCSEARYAM